MRLKSLIATAGAICFAAFLASPAFAQTKAGTDPADLRQLPRGAVESDRPHARTAPRATRAAACARRATVTPPSTSPGPDEGQAGGQPVRARRRRRRAGGRLPDLPQRQPQPGFLDVRQACDQRRRLHQLPQRPRQEPDADDQQVRHDVPAQPGRRLRHLPPADPRRDASSPRTTRSSKARSSAPTATTRTARCRRSMVKQPTINDQCYSCHADKRGPYVFNHPPVEENCASCHNPHGSVHYKLLNEHTPNLCQDCHEWSRHPGTIYGAAAAGPARRRRERPGEHRRATGKPPGR